MTTPDAIIKIRLAKDNAERVTFLCQDAGCSIDWSNEFQKSITDGLDVAVSFAEQNTKLQYESEAIVKYFDDLFHALELLMINKKHRLVMPVLRYFVKRVRMPSIDLPLRWQMCAPRWRTINNERTLNKHVHCV